MKRNIRFAVICLLAFTALMLTGCISIEKTQIASGITQAENSLFTIDGRLFVTGGDSVWEIHRDLSKTKLTTPPCSTITGIVQRGNYIYANCNTGNLALGTARSFLIAAPLSQANPVFNIVQQYDNACLANGMAVAPDGALYIANSTGIASSMLKVVISSTDPMQVADQKVWLSWGGFFPNGVEYKNNYIYYTAFNTVRRVAIDGDGHGPVETLYTNVEFLDDFCIIGDKIIVADYINGKLIALDLSGHLLGQTSQYKFNTPTSVTEAKAPIFNTQGVLVTEQLSGKVWFVTAN
ncbi:MAG: hypothetical protein ACM3PP_04255 [Candidatus Saccharibacteria bacterium]